MDCSYRKYQPFVSDLFYKTSCLHKYYGLAPSDAHGYKYRSIARTKGRDNNIRAWRQCADQCADPQEIIKSRSSIASMHKLTGRLPNQ